MAIVSLLFVLGMVAAFPVLVLVMAVASVVDEVSWRC